MKNNQKREDAVWDITEDFLENYPELTSQMALKLHQEDRLTDVVVELGKAMIKRNLPNSTEIFGLITLGEVKRLTNNFAKETI